MKNINWNSLLSWSKVIVTLALIAAAAVIAYKSIKYIRAFVKRVCLVVKLRYICRKNGYEIEKLASCYKSIWRPTDGAEILITTPEKKYEIKFFTCLRYRDTYTFDGIEHYTTRSNTKMLLVDSKYPSSGIANVGELWMPRTARAESGVINEIEVTGSAPKTEYPGVEKILCINPVSVEIRRVVRSTTEQVFDGDKLDGCTVYSGDKLCHMIEKTTPGTTAVSDKTTAAA